MNEQHPTERELLIRTALTEDIERWQCMDEFTTGAIDRAVQILLNREASEATRDRHEEYLRYRARKNEEE